jgi:hypothetical protein
VGDLSRLPEKPAGDRQGHALAARGRVVRYRAPTLQVFFGSSLSARSAAT